MDNLSPDDRRKNMRAIRGRDTSIEVLLRKVLWKRGHRYRKNYRKLDGVPDIVFLKQKVAIFCDSEFWHGKYYENSISRISTNKDYWAAKIQRNIERDSEVTKVLNEKGWLVLRFWGNDIKKNPEKIALEIEKKLAERDGYGR